MFSKAVPIAAGFTRPMVISSRTSDGVCSSTIGTCVVVNRSGWILTAGHLLEIVRLHQESARRYTGYRDNVVEFHRDTAADKRFRKRGVRTFHKPAASAVRNHSVWWGADSARLVEARLLLAADLALGRLEPFDPASVARLPVFKNPSEGYEPGPQSLQARIPPAPHRAGVRRAGEYLHPARGRGAVADVSAGWNVHQGDQHPGAPAAARETPSPSSRRRHRACSARWADRSSTPTRWSGGSSPTRCTIRSDSARGCRAGRQVTSSTSSSTPVSRCTLSVIRNFLDAEGIDHEREG